MIFFMNKVIWQPRDLYQPSLDFDVDLDSDFAREMLGLKLSPGVLGQMKSLGLETASRFGFNYPEPYNFQENTGLITGFYIGKNGTWLSTSRDLLYELEHSPKSDKPLEYSSHNIDSTNEAYALMALFDRYVQYAGTLKELAERK
jgi:hypothetical protein